MPSIPQSLLWISLVVLWLFVLVPMLVSRRDAVRRTSDVALATRVLNGVGGARLLLRRGGPATGHRSDPDWQPLQGFDDYHLDDVEVDEARSAPVTRSVVVVAAAAEEAEPDYLDVDVVDEDSGALPVGAMTAPASEEAVAEEAVLEDELDEELVDEDVAADWTAPIPRVGADTEDEYEYIEDSSGLEAAADNDDSVVESLNAARRRRYESNTAAAVSARKYKFRKRVLLVMAATLVASATTAFVVRPTAWWACAAIGAVTLLYLGYLRRQTRIEARLRRRRVQRMARSRLGVENTDDHEFDVVPSRLRRPGAIVLEIDDEDPVFEHLEYAAMAQDYDLPRAAGQ